MGLFISNCKKCNKEITWFLQAPDVTCKACGTFNSAANIEDSWHENYFNFQVEACMQRYDAGHGYDLDGFNIEYGQKILTEVLKRQREQKQK